VLDGGRVARDDAMWLINLESSADILDLLSWRTASGTFQEAYQIHLCSIVNAKAGAVLGEFSLCAPRHRFTKLVRRQKKVRLRDPEAVFEAAD